MLYMNGGKINCHTCIGIVFAINIYVSFFNYYSNNLSAKSAVR